MAGRRRDAGTRPAIPGSPAVRARRRAGGMGGECGAVLCGIPWIGERVRLTLTLVSLRQTIMNYRTPDGSKATWFASGDPGDAMTQIGREYDVVATIKRHDQYQGIKQTTLARIVPYVEKVRKS